MIYEDKLAETVAEYLVSKGCKKDEAVDEARELLAFIRNSGNIILSAKKLEEIKQRKT
jgi:hypothetical protein